MFYHNFTTTFDPESFEQQLACDGNITQDSRGLILDSSQYTTHLPGEFDHIKWLTFLRNGYRVQEGEFIYEACISAKQVFSIETIPTIYRKRIRNIHEDHRLCSSGIIIYDEESMITTQILLTNDWIYGYYEKRLSQTDQAAFTSIIPLCKRGNFSRSTHNIQDRPDDYIQVGIGIDSHRCLLKFYINRQEMFCIPRLGYRLADQYQVNEFGGTPNLSHPGYLRFGFGHFSFLDHHLPNNYSRQHVIESINADGYPVSRLASGLAQLLPSYRYREPYPDFTGEYQSIDPSISFAYTGDDPSYFIFGQGIISQIKYIMGYVVNNPATIPKMLLNHSSNDLTPSVFTPQQNQSFDTESDSSEKESDSFRKHFNRPPIKRQNIDPKVDTLYHNKNESKQQLGESVSSLSVLYRKSREKLGVK